MTTVHTNPGDPTTLDIFFTCPKCGAMAAVTTDTTLVTKVGTTINTSAKCGCGSMMYAEVTK